MAKINTILDELSVGDQQKAEFMVEVAYLIHAVDHEEMEITEAYDKIIQLLGTTEIERILQVIYYKKVIK